MRREGAGLIDIVVLTHWEPYVKNRMGTNRMGTKPAGTGLLEINDGAIRGTGVPPVQRWRERARCPFPR